MRYQKLILLVLTWRSNDSVIYVIKWFTVLGYFA